MLKLFNRKKKDNKGFTLVELVIVVAILAILVGILAPQYTKYVEKSRKAADASNLENLVTAFKTAASDGTDTVATGTYTFTISTDGTTLRQQVTAQDGTTTGKDNTDIENVITSYAGANWQGTKLKSSRWTKDGKADGAKSDTISAKLVVANDGSVTVTYEPDTFKNQANGEYIK